MGQPDLAAAPRWASCQLRLARGERVAKYNRLLEIAGSRPDLPYGLADL